MGHRPVTGAKVNLNPIDFIQVDFSVYLRREYAQVLPFFIDQLNPLMSKHFSWYSASPIFSFNFCQPDQMPLHIMPS